MIKIISIDFQKDFTLEGGCNYKTHRPSVDFVKNTLVPFLRKHKIKIYEIVSDYRQPRPGDRGDSCHPGELGFESDISDDVKDKKVWIKCMNSPLWMRKNIGVSNKKAGLPYQDTKAFEKWLLTNIGKPQDNKEIILIGLTADCCVLSTAQELTWRGYKVKILEEATDVYKGSLEDKKAALKLMESNRWAEVITWKEFKNRFN